MKNLIVITLTLASVLTFAQNNDNPCAQLDILYSQKVEENIALKSRIKSLEKDSVMQANVITNLMRDTTQIHKQLREINARYVSANTSLGVVHQQLNQCRKDSATLQKQLNERKSLTLQQYKDSLDKMSITHVTLIDSISKLQANITSSRKESQKQKEELKQLTAIVNLLSKSYEKVSVDELYAKHDKGELNLYKELCSLVNKKVTSNIEQAIVCFKAQEQSTLKYDRILIDQLQKQLPMGTKTGKQLSQTLQRYALANSEANTLWIKIHDEVCDKPIDNNDDFLQIQKKRQIWQRAQAFLNKYPNLSADYPYVYEQIQSMLRQIWTNANNFNAIKNPFE